MRYQTDVTEKDGHDVVVCGGGCAGVAAAIAAARNGAKTALIEKSYALGGTAYNGLVGPFMTSFNEAGTRQINKGIFDEIVTRMEKRGGAIHPSRIGDVTEYGCFISTRHNNVGPFEPEAMKFVCFEMLAEAGVKLFLNHTLVEAMTKNGAVTGAICFDGLGFSLFPGKVFVDCTGDAILSAKAGVEFDIGDESNGLTQPMTLFFTISGVDDAKVIEYITSDPKKCHTPFNKEIEAARAKGKFPINRSKIGLYKMVKPGQWRINTTRIQDASPLDPDDLSRAYAEGMKQVDFLLEFFKTLPGMEKSRLLQSGTVIGIRDSRRIKGVYTLTGEDIYGEKKFDDCIALSSYPIDLHPSSGSNLGIKDGDRMTPDAYQIPYRILVPEKIDSLLVAGRCVSASFEAMGAIRTMPTVMCLGHAAGIAAAQSAKGGMQPRNLDVKQLREELSAEGGVF